MPEILGTLIPPRQSVAPSSPSTGQLYYDTDDNMLYWWNGTQWVQAAPTVGGPVYDSDQIGTVKSYSGTTIPANWMLADGRSLLRADYPELFTAIGTRYGTADGTHFNIPDLTRRFVYGATSADLAAALAIGGAATHTLTQAEMPVHAHAGTTGAADRSLDHLHGGPSQGGIYYSDVGANWAWMRNDAAQFLFKGQSQTGAMDRSIDHLHPFSTDNRGSGTAHNNLPPYILVALIIKVTGAQINSGGALVGPQGTKGDPGPWRGVWAAATAYNVGDSVSFNDGATTSSYRRKVAGTTAGDPKTDTTNWEIVASGGSVGADGESIAIFEQPDTPAVADIGDLWIDTDELPYAWASGIPLVAVLPTNPANGQEVYFLADATNGVIWHLRYRLDSPSIYKWEFVGGSALHSQVQAQETTTSTTYAALATAGPLITLPLAGDYTIEHGAENHASNAGGAFMSYDIGATAASDLDSAANYVPTVVAAINVAMRKRKTGLAAATTLTAKYRAQTAVTVYFARRWLSAMPVRVG